MTDKLEPTVERLRHTFQAVADQVVDAPPVFHAVPIAATPIDDTSDPMTVADVQRTGREKTARGRRLLGAAAVVAAVTLTATAVLLQRTGDDGIRTKPAGQGSTTIPAPPTTVLTPPSTVRGDDSTAGASLPEGVPSSPHLGELVVSAASIHYATYQLYADGRLIWGSDSQFGTTSWFERRLTPEGVERVRSHLLSSGVFDAAQPPGEGPPCRASFGACIRDGERLLYLPDAGEVVTYLSALNQTLPATEWADREIKPYIASRIAVCVRTYVNQAEAALDLPTLLPHFPPRAAELLGGREPNAALVTSLSSGLGINFLEGSCFELTLDEAHALRDAFLDPSTGGVHEYWGIVLRYRQPGPTQPEAVYVWFGELLPDGVPRFFPG